MPEGEDKEARPGPQPQLQRASPSAAASFFVDPRGLTAARKDVDFLVQEIKENLKLGHCAPHGPMRPGLSRRTSHRASPYPRVPAPSGRSSSGCEASSLKKWNHRRRYPSTCMNVAAKDAKDDPFEMLQELISDGKLIKEAVRRLQMGLTPTKYNNGNFYDSDEDCRTPPAFPDLCCEVAGI